MTGEAFCSQPWVSRKTGIYNCPVLSHASLKSSWGLSAIESPVALGMIRELRYHGHDTSTCMGNQTKVKGPVGKFPAFVLFGSGQLGHLSKESFEQGQLI